MEAAASVDEIAPPDEPEETPADAEKKPAEPQTPAEEGETVVQEGETAADLGAGDPQEADTDEAAPDLEETGAAPQESAAELEPTQSPETEAPEATTEDNATTGEFLMRSESGNALRGPGPWEELGHYPQNSTLLAICPIANGEGKLQRSETVHGVCFVCSKHLTSAGHCWTRNHSVLGVVFTCQVQKDIIQQTASLHFQWRTAKIVLKTC